jgi:sporulation protein YlmC with PRC-barrel domain
MVEKKIAVVPDVPLGPWFGEIYDLVLTDRRFLLCFVEKFTTKTKPPHASGRSLEAYDKESIDVLASRDKSISIPYSNVQRIRMKKALVEQPAWYYLIVHHEDSEGKKGKLKMIIHAPQEQGQLEYAIEVRTMIERALPTSVLQNAEWPF